MNIFAVDESPAQAAKDLCNKHVVKMIVESAQIMCTAFRLKMEECWQLAARDAQHYPNLYKATHRNHPAVKWTLASVHNTEWLWQHLEALEREYRARYAKVHGSGRVIEELNQVKWSIWRGTGKPELHTPFVQCMPEQYRRPDAVAAYRQFYIGEKARFAQWQPRAQPPSWWPS